MGIYLSGSGTAVSWQRLDVAQIRMRFQQVYGKAMPQFMGRNMLAYACLFRCPGGDVSNTCPTALPTSGAPEKVVFGRVVLVMLSEVIKQGRAHHIPTRPGGQASTHQHITTSPTSKNRKQQYSHSIVSFPPKTPPLQKTSLNACFN